MRDKEGTSRETALLDEDGDRLWIEPADETTEEMLFLESESDGWVLTPNLKTKLGRLLLGITDSDLSALDDATVMGGLNGLFDKLEGR